MTSAQTVDDNSYLPMNKTVLREKLKQLKANNRKIYKFESKTDLLVKRSGAKEFNDQNRFQFEDKERLRNMKHRVRMKKEIFTTKQEWKETFNQFMAPRQQEPFYPHISK